MHVSRGGITDIRINVSVDQLLTICLNTRSLTFGFSSRNENTRSFGAYLMRVWLKSSPILSRSSELLSRPLSRSLLGFLRRACAILHAISPSDALLEPRCGVPKKQIPEVAGAIYLSAVPSVDLERLSAALTMIPPRLYATKMIGFSKLG